MKKLLLLICLGLVINFAYSQDLETGGSNSWLFHTPDDGRTTLHIAPKINGQWAWGNQTRFLNNGDVLFTGKIGIGTEAPYGKLHVFSQNSPTQYYDGELHVGGFIGNTNDVTMIIGTHYTNKTTFLQGWRAGFGSTPILFQPQGGNVGIGTTAPTTALDVNGTMTVRQQGYGTTASPYETVALKGYVSDANAYPSINFVNDWQSTHRSWMNFNVRDGNHNKITVLTIHGNGNVGIGTTNPQYKLAVEGSISAREVKVTTESWADFVFRPTYQLRTLGEVEQFIKTNNHLPEIPTEAEVKENGLGLGEMNAKLLQKIEELTLYMIEMQKQNEELRSRVSKLEKK